MSDTSKPPQAASVSPAIEVREASFLSSYAVEARYPGEWEDVSEEDYRHAIELADRVLRWAQGLIESPS